MSEVTTLYTKLAKITGEVERIPKNGKNSHFNYTFATESDISDAIRKLLSENNIAIFASLVKWDQKPVGNSFKTICDFEFTLACGDTGATHICTWSAEANDNQDKGFNKAATAAMKYWLLKTFMIPTGDDPDSDNTSTPKGAKGTSATPTQRAQQKANPYTKQSPAAPATLPPSQPATAQASEPNYDAIEKAAREKAVTALDNEAITIFKVNYQPTHNGNGVPSWIATARIADGSTIPVNVGERGAALVTKAGYMWPKTDADNLAIDVITSVSNGKRYITSVICPDGSIISEEPRNAANANVGANNIISDAWLYDRTKLLYAIGKQFPKITPQERAATADKMHKEGLFDELATLEDAVTMVANRLASHRQAVNQ